VIRVYVAGPLSNGDREVNVHNAEAAGVELLKMGCAPYVPHLWWYVDPDDSLGYDVWTEMDLAWVEASHALLRLPGKSNGVRREVRRARQLGIPVFYSVEEIRKWMIASQRVKG
jgi:hypothetical protein